MTIRKFLLLLTTFKAGYMCAPLSEVVETTIQAQDTQSPHKTTFNFLGMTHKMNTRKTFAFLKISSSIKGFKKYTL